MTEISDHHQQLKDGRHLLIREVTVDDAPMMLRNFQTIVAETDQLLSTVEEAQITLADEEAHIRRAKEAGGLWLCALVDGVIIGGCGLRGAGRVRKSHDLDFGIAVQRAYWGLGIGRTLMEQALAWARVMGFHRISLSVMADNTRAYRLYRDFGFEEEGRVRDAYCFGDRYRDGIMMGLLLSEPTG